MMPMMPTRKEILEQSTANCKLCKETPIPDYFGSPRSCAFDESGKFTEHNWNCETANALRALLYISKNQITENSKSVVSVCLRYDDRSAAMLHVYGIGWVFFSWYKQHGQTERIWTTYGSPITLKTAEEIIKLATEEGAYATED